MWYIFIASWAILGLARLFHKETLSLSDELRKEFNSLEVKQLLFISTGVLMSRNFSQHSGEPTNYKLKKWMLEILNI